VAAKAAPGDSGGPDGETEDRKEAGEEAMKATILACQGCGAELSVKKDARAVKCAYCGATNTFEKPESDKPGKQAKKAAKAGARIALVSTILFLAIGGGIAYFVNKTVSDTTSQVQKNVAEAQDRAAGLQNEAQDRVQKARAEVEARRLEAEGKRALSGGPARPGRSFQCRGL